MKNVYKLFLGFVMLGLMAMNASANTWGAPCQVYPHGGTGVNAHDFLNPSNLTNATAIANFHGWFTYNIQALTSEQCQSGAVWTYFTFDSNPPRNGVGAYTGYVHFMRQDCP